MVLVTVRITSTAVHMWDLIFDQTSNLMVSDIPVEIYQPVEILDYGKYAHVTMLCCAVTKAYRLHEFLSIMVKKQVVLNR